MWSSAFINYSYFMSGIVSYILSFSGAILGTLYAALALMQH